MAGDLGTLFVKVDAETKDYNKKIDAAGKKTEKFAKDLKKFGDNAFKFATLPILGLGIASLKFASDAEEANAKFNTAFKGIEDQAKTTAEALAENYGLAIFQSEKLLGNTGDLLKGFGATATEALSFSNEIQELSVDLASYNNVVGGAERVSRILTKSVLGNKDGLSELGVVLLDADINQELVRRGQEKLTGQAKLLAKAQATYSLILKQTGDAQNDYARTQDSIANRTKELVARTKDLAIVFGNELLPIANEVVNVALDAVKAFTSLSDTNKDIIITVAGITLVIAPAIKAVNGLKLAFTGLNGAIGLVLLAVTGLVAGIKKLQELDAAKQEKTFGSIAESTGIAAADLKTIADISAGIIVRADSIAEGFRIAAENSGLTKKQLKDVLEVSGNLTAAQIKYIETLTRTATTSQDLIRLSQDRVEALAAVKEEADAQAAAELEANNKLIETNENLLESERLLKEGKQQLRDEERAAREQGYQDKERAEIENNNEVYRLSKELKDKQLQDSKDKADEERRIREQLVQNTLSVANSILEISSNLADGEIADLQRVADAKIAALNLETEQETALSAFKAALSTEDLERSIIETTAKIADLIAIGDEDSIQTADELQRDLDNSAELLRLDDLAVTSREDRAGDIEQIEKDLALQKYEIELEQFKANKAISALQAAVNTAVAVSNLLLFPPLALAVGVAGAAQVGAILSQPEPKPPAFALGGTVRGATAIIAGEDRGEVMLGMGAKGAPLIEELATRIASISGGGGQTIININSLYPPRRQDLDRLFRDGYPSQIKEQQRRGIK